MVKQAPLELVKQVVLHQKQQVRHKCCLCQKSFKEYFLTALHIRNRHSDHAVLLPKLDLNWLGGLLKPQSSEKFRARKKTKCLNTKERSPISKPSKFQTKKDTGKTTQKSKFLSTNVCSAILSNKATPLRVQGRGKAKCNQFQLEDWQQEIVPGNKSVFGDATAKDQDARKIQEPGTSLEQWLTNLRSLHPSPSPCYSKVPKNPHGLAAQTASLFATAIGTPGIQEPTDHIQTCKCPI